MNGRYVAGGLVGIAAVGGVVLWWLITYGFYERVSGIETVEIAGAEVPVSDYRGIDSEGRPLKLRGCFRLDDPAAALVGAPPAEDPKPLRPPFWFDCFDIEALDADLRSGAATAIIAESAHSFQRLIAIYPDGRAYQWRRLDPAFDD